MRSLTNQDVLNVLNDLPASYDVQTVQVYSQREDEFFPVGEEGPYVTIGEIKANFAKLSADELIQDATVCPAGWTEYVLLTGFATAEEDDILNEGDFYFICE